MNHKARGASLTVVLVSMIVAIISLFLPWVDAGFFSVNGFQQQGYLLLILFIYPLICIIKKVKVNAIVGYISAIIGLVFMIFFIGSKSVEIFGTSFSGAASGMYVMLISFIILAVGVFLGQKNK